MYEIPDIMLRHRKDAEKVMTDEVSKQQTAIHQTVGGLVAIWANVETNLIHLAGRLLQTSPTNVHVTYLSFGAMRARENYLFALVENNLDGEDRNRAASLLKRFKKLSEVRNELVHSEYLLDPNTYAYVGTVYTRLDNQTQKITHKQQPLDQQRINSIRLTAEQLMDLGREILTFCKELDERRKQQAEPQA